MEVGKVGGSNARSSVKRSQSKGHTQTSSAGGVCVGAAPKFHILQGNYRRSQRASPLAAWS